MGCSSSSAASPDQVPCLGEDRSAKKFSERYVLQDTLLDGAFASVHVCVDRKTRKERHAVKAIKFGALPRYHQKQRVMARLGCHDSVVGVLGRYAGQDLTCYFLMDLCKTTLPVLMKQQPDYILEESRLSSVFRQMLSGLQHCHSRGIVHRDVRPESFLVGFDDTVKLASFGEAAFADIGLRGTAGKVPFMSPEMLNGQVYGIETDIWSFGVMAYTLLFGEHPYGIDLGDGVWSESDVASIFAEGKIQPSYVPAGFPQRSPIARTSVRSILETTGSKRPSANDCMTLFAMLQLSHDTLKQMQDVLRPELAAVYQKTLLCRPNKYETSTNLKEQTLDIILEQ